MNQTDKICKFFSWLFLSTGIFAIVGAIYTWGEGPIFDQNNLLAVLVPWGDLLITGPLSLLAAFGVARRKPWGFVAGLMVCGIYLFGSALVYISLIWEGAPYPFKLAFPPIIGVGFGISYPIWLLRNQQVFSQQPEKINHNRAVKRIRVEEVLW
ncbi:MAG: hypothetical protein MUP11_03335 [Anaerolineales bacterium]|nr:hypothetical protein [Anaerolineales bacterium]